MTGWPRGREEIVGMIERHELTRVVADDGLAKRMIATARRHLAGAELLAGDDPYLAYAALHDAVRQALAALLQTQGLRATTTGGHLAVQHAAKAQFGATMGAICARWTAVSPGLNASTRPRRPGSTRTPSGTTFRRHRPWSTPPSRCSPSCRRSP